jgi:hypothetical protein
MVYSVLLLMIFSVTFDAKDTYAQAGFQMSAMESNTDRAGSDYNVLNLPTSDPGLCQDACARDPRCMAWTFVRPNTIQGPQPRCWLKQAIPPPSSNSNCVSGYKLR